MRQQAADPLPGSDDQSVALRVGHGLGIVIAFGTLAGLLVGLVYVFVDALTTDIQIPADPGFVDNIIASSAVVAAVRVGDTVAADNAILRQSLEIAHDTIADLSDELEEADAVLEVYRRANVVADEGNGNEGSDAV